MSAISRNYRPEMRPALRQALASDIPAIRVQAAAIYAKLRGRFEGRARALAASQSPFDEANARDAVEVALSGFVKDEIAAALLSRVDRGGDIGISGRGERAVPIHARMRPAVGAQR